MIIGTGVDIVETERIGKALSRYGDRFIERLLTAPEQESWRGRGARLETLAGYWAAKEAVAKALGTGFVGFGLRDIVITHDSLGCPRATFTNGAASLVSGLGITQMWVSISHSASYAVATAIAEAAKEESQSSR